MMPSMIRQRNSSEKASCSSSVTTGRPRLFASCGIAFEVCANESVKNTYTSRNTQGESAYPRADVVGLRYGRIDLAGLLLLPLGALWKSATG